MRLTSLLIVLLCCSLSAHANDGAIRGVGGTLQPLKGEHKTIRMVREHVRMTMLPDGLYRVTVDFVFRNNGRATSVLMGFPESGGGVDVDATSYKTRSNFRSFATWVDGRRVRARYVLSPERISQSYKSYWIKRVRFARRQTRHVRVRYTTRYGGTTVGNSEAVYDFTGGNWRGNVVESLLTATIKVPGTHAVQTDLSYNTPTGRGSREQHQRGNRFFYRMRNWQAEGTFSLNMLTLLPRQMAVNFDRAENYLPGSQEYRIEVPDSSTPAIRSAGSRYLVNSAPATLHGGMAVLSLRDLEKWFNSQDKLYERVQPCSLRWNQGQKTAWLRAGPHVFGFRSGKAHMVINDKVHRLPLPPLLVRHNNDYILYVPLSPIMKTFGGKVKAVPEERRIWFHL